jgi:hypothetical protein
MDEMIREARRMAAVAMKQRGRLAPTLMASITEGLLIHCPADMNTEQQKDRFVTECRLILMATAATRCALLLETWASMAKRGALLGCPPSESPDRIEAVSIFAEERGSRSQMLLLPIIRNASGKFLRLGDDSAPPGLEAHGRFAQQLPPKTPTNSDIETARLLLGAMGIKLPCSGGGFSNN